MKCLFCKKDTSISKSREHIIPESLGNKSHISPKRYTCDSCNNSFSIKVEKQQIKSLRFQELVCNKKRNMHKINGIVYFDKREF